MNKIEKETWKIMNLNRYNYICLFSLIMIIFSLFIPFYQSSDGSSFGTYCWFSIMGTVFIASGLGGWIASREVALQENKDGDLK